MPRKSPFCITQPITRPQEFFGRHGELYKFWEMLKADGLRCGYVWGARRSGKTSYLRMITNPDLAAEQLGTDAARSLLMVYVDCSHERISDPNALHTHIRSSIMQSRQIADGAGIDTATEALIRFEDWILAISREWRTVIVLDEIHSLLHRPGFDKSFFRGLRAVLEEAGGRLAMVTASHIPMLAMQERIDRQVRPMEEDSHLFNVFTWDATIGPLSARDARDAVVRPLDTCDIRISDDDLDTISRVSGRLPYIVNCVAERWLQMDAPVPLDQGVAAKIVDDLLHPAKGHLLLPLKSMFQSLSREQRLALEGCVRDDAAGCPVGVLEDCMKLGLLEKTEERFGPSGTIMDRAARELVGPMNTLKVFLTHSSHNNMWREVQDRLLSLRTRTVEVVEFNSDLPYGQSAFQRIEEAAEGVNLAVILMTRDNDAGDPRLNVVHETGYFQGKLGRERTLLLIEKGVTRDLSNIHGLQGFEFDRNDRHNDIHTALDKLEAVINGWNC